MEKICARCQFRNPPSRGVCQVCGYAKFHRAGTEAICIAKQPPTPLSLLLTQTVAAAAAAIEKIADARKQADARQPLNNSAVPSTKSTSTVDNAALTTFENNDLDSMIAWFKSYGVDKPLILEQKTTTTDHSRAA